MSDLIPDTRQLSKDGDINSLRQYFNEPSRLSWPEAELKELDDLYQIALTQDTENPVGWIQEFDRSHPRKLDVGHPSQRRLGKILWMAKLLLDRNAAKEKKKSQKERNF